MLRRHNCSKKPSNGSFETINVNSQRRSTKDEEKASFDLSSINTKGKQLTRPISTVPTRHSAAINITETTKIAGVDWNEPFTCSQNVRNAIAKLAGWSKNGWN
jgi:hypothetical protein